MIDDKKTSRKEVIVIGGGPGGYVAAIKCAQSGKEVLLIEERDKLGGVCLNEGCVPTKALLKSIHLLKTINGAQSMGITIDGTVKAEPAEMVLRSQMIVDQIASGLKILMEKNNIEVAFGKAKLLTCNKDELKDEIIEADDIILASGTTPKDIAISGGDLSHVMYSRDALKLKSIPKHLLIIGAGAIGIEFASIYKGLGSEVTVLEMMPNIIPGSDIEMSIYLLETLKNEGIEFSLEAKLSKITNKKAYFINNEGVEKAINCDGVLVAAGRNPNTCFISPDIDIFDENRAVKTNSKMQTKANGLWAIGDVNGKFTYAHIASAEGVVAASNICGQPKEIDYSVVPNVVYTDPEFAWTGITEEMAANENIDYEKAIYPLSSNARNLCEGYSQGLIKVIAGKKYKEILGVHIIGPHAGEIISEAMLAIKFEITADELLNIIHAHPSVSEIYTESAFQIMGNALHG